MLSELAAISALATNAAMRRKSCIRSLPRCYGSGTDPFPFLAAYCQSGLVLPQLVHQGVNLIAQLPEEGEIHGPKNFRRLPCSEHLRMKHKVPQSSIIEVRSEVTEPPKIQQRQSTSPRMWMLELASRPALKTATTTSIAAAAAATASPTVYLLSSASSSSAESCYDICK